MSKEELNLITFTLALCVLTWVWVYVFCGKIQKASQDLIDSNRELLHTLHGWALGKGHDLGGDE